jgi:hypothetical protein
MICVICASAMNENRSAVARLSRERFSEARDGMCTHAVIDPTETYLNLFQPWNPCMAIAAYIFREGIGLACSRVSGFLSDGIAIGA